MLELRPTAVVMRRQHRPAVIVTANAAAEISDAHSSAASTASLQNLDYLHDLLDRKAIANYLLDLTLTSYARNVEFGAYVDCIEEHNTNCCILDSHYRLSQPQILEML